MEGIGLFNEISKILREHDDVEAERRLAVYMRSLLPADFDRLDGIAKEIEYAPAQAEFVKIVEAGRKLATEKGSARRESRPESVAATGLGQMLHNYREQSAVKRTMSQVNTSSSAVRSFTLKVATPPIAFAPGQTNKTGFPTSQLIDVYGLSGCFQIAFDANTALRTSITRQNYAHLPDIQGYLQQEAAAAYAMLSTPGARHLWDAYCTHDLIVAVQTLNLDQL